MNRRRPLIQEEVYNRVSKSQEIAASNDLSTRRKSSFKFKIHPVFWFVVAAGLLTGHFWEVVTVFFIVLVHECGHAFAALYLGWRVTEVQLLPFGGVAKVDENGSRPIWEELVVTVSGPIQHLWLPFLSHALLFTDYWNQSNHQLFLTYNFMILLFNLLPIWPLDGGKLIFLFLMKIFPFRRAYAMILILSFLFLIILTLFITLSFPFNLNYFIVGSFIGLSIFKEWKGRRFVFMRFLLSRWRDSKPYASTRLIVVAPDMPVVSILDLFHKGMNHSITIKGRSQRISEKELLAAYFKGNCLGRSIGECFG